MRGILDVCFDTYEFLLVCCNAVCYRPQGKVMFSEVPVSHSVHRGGGGRLPSMHHRSHDQWVRGSASRGKGRGSASTGDGQTPQ